MLLSKASGRCVTSHPKIFDHFLKHLFWHFMPELMEHSMYWHNTKEILIKYLSYFCRLSLTLCCMDINVVSLFFIFSFRYSVSRPVETHMSGTSKNSAQHAKVKLLYFEHCKHAKFCIVKTQHFLNFKSKLNLKDWLQHILTLCSVHITCTEIWWPWSSTIIYFLVHPQREQDPVNNRFSTNILK